MKTPPLRGSLTLISALAALAGPVATSARAQAAANAPASSTAQAASTDLATVAAELRKVIDAKLAAINAGEDVPNRFDWTALDGQFDELASELRTLPAQEARNRLRNVSNNLKSDETRQLLTRLGAAVEAEAKAAETARHAALEKKFTDISRAALAASKPEDLDPIHERLEDLQQEINEFRGPRQSRFHNLLNRQQNFINAWQNILDAVADGNRQMVRNAESNLSGGYARAQGVGASEIRARVRELLAKIPADGESSALLANLTLDGLEETQRQLMTANESMGWNNEANTRSQVAYMIDQIRLASLSLEAGDLELALRQLTGQGATVFHGGMMSTHFVPMQRLRTAWLGRSLPRLAGVKDLAPPAEGEFPEPYVRRLVLAADAAGEHDKAAALARVLGRLAFVAVGPARSDTEDNLAAAYQHFLAGRRLEAVGEREDAAKSYRQAVVAGAPEGLTKVLAERLRVLSAPPTTS